jgi:hypothetical protein
MARVGERRDNLAQELSTAVIHRVEELQGCNLEDYCQRVASEKPIPTKPKPTNIFQAPMPGIG